MTPPPIDHTWFGHCVCCERPFTDLRPCHGELTYQGQHGNGCEACIELMKEAGEET